MAEIEQTRSFQLFLSAIKSEATEITYVYWLNKWLDHNKCSNHDELLQKSPQEIQKDIENFLLKLRTNDKLSSSRIATQFNAIILFYSMNDVILNVIKLRKMLPKYQSLWERKPYTTKQIQKIIKAIDISKQKKNKHWGYRKPRAKALILFFASSGVRVGSITELKIKHLEKMGDLYCVKVYGDSNQSYYTFITPEATKALDEYLALRKNLDQDSFVFDLSSHAVQKLLERLVSKVEDTPAFEGEDTNEFNDISLVHGFRSRFNTILRTQQNPNIGLIESMMGHSFSNKLDANYLKATPKQLLDEYSKSIKDLTIFKNA